MKKTKTITYIYRGGVERGTGNGYAWANGYSEESAGVRYPWMTRKECQEDARRRGAVARFEMPQEKKHTCPRCGSRRKIDIAGSAWRCQNCGQEWNKPKPEEKQLGADLAQEHGV